MIPLVDLRAQYRSIKDEVGEAMSRVLESCQFVLGEEVQAFEAEFAAYCEATHAIGVNSGTSALHLSLLATGVGPADEVITVPNTFVATAAAIRYVGAKPVLVDIEPSSCTMDPTQLEAAITPRTKAIIPVHLYGQCADMEPILRVARRHGLIVIEDAAQAHGARYKGRRAGTLADLACFSFYPGKNLGAYGEGGAVVTNDLRYAERIRVLRDHGQSSKYRHVTLGYNYRLEALQAAVLRVKLRHLDDWNGHRRAHAGGYRKLLAGSGMAMLDEMDYGVPVYHVFPVFTPFRDALREHLNRNGIAAAVHYPVPVHLQPAYEDLGYRIGGFPHSERASGTTLSLPMYPELSSDDLARIADCIRAFIAERRPPPAATRGASKP